MDGFPSLGVPPPIPNYPLDRLTPITRTKVAILQFETHLSINYLDREKEEDTLFEDY